MSTELTIAQEMGQSLAEMMGISTSTGGQSSNLARIAQVQTPIMGVVDVGGKKLKTETVPVGAYKITMPDETVVYSQEVSIRIFAIRQQWQRWNSDTNVMEKTVMANNLNGDLKDNTGRFNLGRPSGYIKDFNALPDATKEVIRSVNRMKVFFGVVTLIGPMDDKGEAIEGDFTEIPFVMDIKNRDSMKSLDDACGALARRNILPIMNTITLAGETKALPNGNLYAVVDAKVGEKVDLKESDNETLRNFMDYINYVNSYILKKWEEAHVEKLSDDDAALVGEFVDMDGDE